MDRIEERTLVELQTIKAILTKLLKVVEYRAGLSSYNPCKQPLTQEEIDREQEDYEATMENCWY